MLGKQFGRDCVLTPGVCDDPVIEQNRDRRLDAQYGGLPGLPFTSYRGTGSDNGDHDMAVAQIPSDVLPIRRACLVVCLVSPVTPRKGIASDFTRRFSLLAQLAGHRLVITPDAIVDRRLKRHSRWGVFLLRFHQAHAMVHYYQLLGSRAVGRSPLAYVLHAYLMIPANLLRGRSYHAVREAGQRLRRLVGSFRSGVLFL